MKFISYLIFVFVFVIPFPCCYSSDLDSIITLLDNTIDKSEEFQKNHEKQIGRIKSKLHSENITPLEEYGLNSMMYDLYKAYICDSAIYYLEKNIRLTDMLDLKNLKNESIVKLADHLASSGLYMEAIDELKEIDRKSLEGELLIKYYVVYDKVYGEAGFYTQDQSMAYSYNKISSAYKDSIYLMADPESDYILSREEEKFRNAGMFGNALAINDKRLANAVVGSRDYAILKFFRALIYQKNGMEDDYIKCLAESAIADIRTSTKDHASLWMLAQVLFDRGDVERAYKYMKFSWNETKTYNARLRVWQSIEDLSLIDDTYGQLLSQRNEALKDYLIYISVLSVLIVIALVYIYMQMKRLSVARRKLIDANKRLELLNIELKSLNEELKNMNCTIKKANDELEESNRIKDEYLTRFIKLCSTYINKLDDFRRIVSKNITSNKVNELLRFTRSEKMLEEPLNELYANFDSAFLHIFPNFVGDFNELLNDDGKIIVKSGEQMNTELRIFALIRLGITDSSQIAEFLRYSVNTIYNYRAKVKNKSKVPREEFEEYVCRIK